MNPDATSCPACGGSLVRWRVVGSAEPQLGPRQFALARCVDCGTAVTLGEPVPSAHLAGAYGGGRPRGARLVSPLLALFDRQRLALLDAGASSPRPATPGANRSPRRAASSGTGSSPRRLIDAGAGRGRFVAAAAEAGYEAIGIEPSLRDVDPALNLIAASIEDAPIDSASADVVTLWHVLEHLEEPAAALAQLGEWLAPGGLLLVGVPNLGSLQARIAGERWYHLDLPRHRAHYTVAGLRTLLERSGFAVDSVHGVLLEHNPFGMWQSLVSFGTRHPSYLYNLLKRNAPLRSPDLAVTLAALPLLPFAVALELAAGALGFGGTVAVVAHRVSL